MKTTWHKSSFSGTNACVQVRAAEDGTVRVRDSKQGDGSPELAFDAAEWDAFTKGVQGGEFTL